MNDFILDDALKSNNEFDIRAGVDLLGCLQSGPETEQVMFRYFCTKNLLLLLLYILII